MWALKRHRRVIRIYNSRETEASTVEINMLRPAVALSRRANAAAEDIVIIPPDLAKIDAAYPPPRQATLLTMRRSRSEHL